MATKQESKTEPQLKEDLKKVCHMAYEKGLVSGNEGNFSLKINDDLILVTSRNSHKGSVEVSDFVTVDTRGNLISNGNKEPTSELALHLEAYKKRPDIKAVVHAHPPHAVAFSVSGLDLNQPAIPEIIVLLGEVPTVPYCEPGTDALANKASMYLEKHDAVILDHHGAITIDKNIFTAYYKMESLEHAAKIMYYAQTLGEIKTLDENSVHALVNQRYRIYGDEVKLREGKKLFQNINEKINFKNVLKKFIRSDSPIFQRILNAANDLTLATINRTTYSQNLTNDEKNQLARELTASFFSMILGRFTKRF